MSTRWSLCDFLAGWGGGVFGLVVGHPLDTLKVRQQVTSGGQGILSMTKYTLKNEGLRGFFKGLSYPMFMSGIYTSVLFGVYGNSLRALETYRGTSERKICCEGEPVGDYWHQDVFVAGCVAGTAVVLVSCPVDLIKIKLQSQSAEIGNTNSGPNASKVNLRTTAYTGPWHAARFIYNKYGLSKGLYRGLVTMLWRDVPTFGLYMITYEHVLCMFKEKEDRTPKTSILSQIVAGGLAGVLSWVIVMPLDVVKSRIQSDNLKCPKYKGMIDCLVKTYRTEGIKALFLGTGLVTVRAFYATAATFVGYEFIMRNCDPHHQKKDK